MEPSEMSEALGLSSRNSEVKMYGDAVYTAAEHVGISPEQVDRLLGTLQMCGWELAPRAEIAAAVSEQQPRWIPVNEKLPEHTMPRSGPLVEVICDYSKVDPSKNNMTGREVGLGYLTLHHGTLCWCVCTRWQMTYFGVLPDDAEHVYGRVSHWREIPLPAERSDFA